MRRSDPFRPKQRRLKRHRCRTCASDNGKRLCPALNGILICPECCAAKRAKIPGCDQRCQYYTPLIRTSKIGPLPDYPVYQCLVSRSKNTGMLIVVVARERPDGNLKAMFLLLDLWKRGIRDCFVDANLPKDGLDRQCEKLGKSYHLGELVATNGQDGVAFIDLPRDTIVIEAESAMYMDDGVKIVEAEGASGGRAIDSQRGARAIHQIKLPRAGKWYVWIRGFFPESSKDSYWIGLDNAEPHPWDEAGGPGAIKIYAEAGDSVNEEEKAAWGIWYWDSGVKSESVPNAYFDVKSAGKHRLWSKGREPGSLLDQILLTRDEKFNPEEKAEGKAIPVSTEAFPFAFISFAECQKLVRYAFDIAVEVETEIPWEFNYWRDILGDLAQAPKMEGSLYKCPKCWEDLPQSTVDLIKRYAQSDEVQFYILCRKCGGEFD